eukprot:480813_1
MTHYDDPSAVPSSKMSFKVYQFKDSTKTSKWKSNMMGFAYIQSNQLWIDFDIIGTNFIIPKTWREVATTASIHKEMMEAHAKHKFSVHKWIWDDYVKGLADMDLYPSANARDGIDDIPDEQNDNEIVNVDGQNDNDVDGQNDNEIVNVDEHEVKNDVIDVNQNPNHLVNSAVLLQPFVDHIKAEERMEEDEEEEDAVEDEEHQMRIEEDEEEEEDAVEDEEHQMRIEEEDEQHQMRIKEEDQMVEEFEGTIKEEEQMQMFNCDGLLRCMDHCLFNLICCNTMISIAMHGLLRFHYCLCGLL